MVSWKKLLKTYADSNFNPQQLTISHIEETETVKDFNKLLEEKKKNEHLLNSYKNLFKQIIEKKNTKQNKISQLNNIEVKTSTKKRGR